MARGVACAAVSGTLSYAACLAADEGTRWGAGIAAAGAAIGVAVDAPDESIAQQLFLFAGFVAWQVGYTVSHRLAPWRRVAPA